MSQSLVIMNFLNALEQKKSRHKRAELRMLWQIIIHATLEQIRGHMFSGTLPRGYSRDWWMRTTWTKCQFRRFMSDEMYYRRHKRFSSTEQILLLFFHDAITFFFISDFFLRIKASDAEALRH